MIAGAVGETAGGAARASSSPSRRTGSRPPRPTSSSPTGGPACAARRPPASRSPSSPTLAYFKPQASCRPGCRPGWRRAAATPPRAPMIWANATHVCTCEVDVDHRRGEAAALHRQRGLRPDDQPERRRGPDRGRHRAGHRRRAARAVRLRRGRQPAHDDLHGLPAAHRDRGARSSSTATSSHPRPAPVATRAWARAAPSAPRRPSSTPWPTRSAPLGVTITACRSARRRSSRLLEEASAGADGLGDGPVPAAAVSHRLEDPLVPGAPAHVAGQAFADLVDRSGSGLSAGGR